MNGYEDRIQMAYYPVDGATLVVKNGATDLSSHVTVEEHTGVVIFDSAPGTNSVITVAGTYYRYFTDAEICNYINIAFLEHAGTATTAYGSKVTMTNLPQVEEYPVVLLATSLALFTLANDAAYDINIFSPDGVTIPRSERYSQLMEMVQARKEQYRELCNLLGVGLHRIEVATLRRISQRTNRYVPIYLPQELDNSGRPQRAHIPIATYMDQTKSVVQTHDIELYRGDSYSFTIDFPFSLVGYDLLAEIRAYSGSPILLDTWTITVTNAANGTATLSLIPTQTSKLPSRSVWDLQITSQSDPDYEHTYIRGTIIVEDQVSNRNNDFYAPSWQG